MKRLHTHTNIRYNPTSTQKMDWVENLYISPTIYIHIFIYNMYMKFISSSTTTTTMIYKYIFLYRKDDKMPFIIVAGKKEIKSGGKGFLGVFLCVFFFCTCTVSKNSYLFSKEEEEETKILLWWIWLFIFTSYALAVCNRVKFVNTFILCLSFPTAKYSSNINTHIRDGRKME